MKSRGVGVLALSIAMALAAAGRGLGASDNPTALSLEQAVSLALARDALVRDAQRALDDARAALVQARANTPVLGASAYSAAASSAGLDPQSAISGTDYSSQSYSTSVTLPMRGGTNVSLGASASTSTTNSVLRAGGGTTFTYASASADIGLSRPLPLFRDERVLTEGPRWSAELGVKQAELALEEARRHVAMDTLTHFFTAFRAQRQVELAQAAAQEADELLRIGKEQLDHGKLAEIEVMEARVSASRAQVTLRSAQSALDTAVDQLRNFLGIPLQEAVRVRHEIGAPITPTSTEDEALVARALAQRPDVQQLALAIRLAQLGVSQAEARARPGFFLNGSYSRSGEAPTIEESLHELVNPSWFVGVAATTTLTRSADKAAIRQARGHLRLGELEQELRRNAVRLEIRRLLRDLQTAADNTAILGQTLKMAEENLAVRQVQFEHGLVRPIDVSQTQRQLDETRSQRLNAAVDCELAGARLKLAAGEMPFAVEGGPAAETPRAQREEM